MLPVGSIVSDLTSDVGVVAATVAVCGFIGQAGPALMRREDQDVRAAAVVGGLIGLLFSTAVAIASRIEW